MMEKPFSWVNFSGPRDRKSRHVLFLKLSHPQYSLHVLPRLSVLFTNKFFPFLEGLVLALARLSVVINSRGKLYTLHLREQAKAPSTEPACCGGGRHPEPTGVHRPQGIVYLVGWMFSLLLFLSLHRSQKRLQLNKEHSTQHTAGLHKCPLKCLGLKGQTEF